MAAGRSGEAAGPGLPPERPEGAQQAGLGSLEGSLGVRGAGSPSGAFRGTGASWREARLPKRPGASGVRARACGRRGPGARRSAPLRGAASGGDRGSAPGGPEGILCLGADCGFANVCAFLPRVQSSTGIPRASPVRASRKSTGPPIPLVPRVEERPGSRCQSRGSTCGAMMLPLSTIGGQGREEVQTRPPQRRALPFERTTGQRREPARKNARVSAKQVPTCPMPGFCFAFYMDSKDSEFDSQPSPGSSRGGSKYTSPAKPRAKYKEIQAWECPLCCLSVLYIS
ncbi:collagen alpha-1(I) chain-like [Bos indicus x Bos taurus]|uniref:collagen alpha-1(I) chain-like n=1 Tax=Bos indicus x Bos taurus TaxID=30522 RepID=UPI000F7D0C93|nr:collagen alpha-1(I) chain-like [Bos indicus x Bos taurus]